MNAFFFFFKENILFYIIAKISPLGEAGGRHKLWPLVLQIYYSRQGNSQQTGRRAIQRKEYTCLDFPAVS